MSSRERPSTRGRCRARSRYVLAARAHAGLGRARELADWGIETFWPNQSSLPRASSRHDHYEAITRADTLAMAQLKLWERETEPDGDLRLRFNDR